MPHLLCPRLPMWHATRNAALRLGATLGMLLMLHHWYGRQLIEAMLPLLRWELTWLADDFRILSLDVVRGPRGGDSVIRLETTLAHFVMLGSHVLSPNPGIKETVSTVTGTVFRPMIMGLTMLVVWPVARSWQYLRRLAIGVPLLLLIFPIDVPLMLLGQLAEVLQFLSHTQGEFAWAISWKFFLQDGGPIVLAFCMAFIAIVMAQKMETSRQTLLTQGLPI